MKKIILLLIPFLIGGCQKKFNDVIGTASYNDIQVKQVPTADSFKYSVIDSSLTVSVTLTSSENVKEVYCNIFTPDGDQLNSTPFQLFDSGNITLNDDSLKGDNQYSNLFPLSRNYVTGNYKIQYYVEDISGNTKLLAYHYFNYNPGTPNVAPVISDLIAPDTATIGTSDLYLVITIKAQDGNGLQDIQSVYFNSYIPPNGAPSTNNPYYLTDDGKNGDLTAGDGIYTITIVLPSTGVNTGKYRWEFFAKDRSGALSNKITHYIVIR